MILRYLPKSKGKLFVLTITLFVSLSVFYFYLLSLQEKNNVLSSGERCLSELSSLKYQLNEVTQYKDRIDKLLTETQHAYESDKERFKDVMENCVALKRQSVLCQVCPHFTLIYFTLTVFMNNRVNLKIFKVSARKPEMN